MCREIESLPFVIPLLAEDADWIENRLALPRFRATGTALAGVLRETPRLCRGGSRSLTDPGVHRGNS